MKFSQTTKYACLSIAMVLVTQLATQFAPADHPTATTTAKTPSDSKRPSERVLILAGGCFWCTEAVFERMDGVNDVVSGYIGGKNEYPTYKQVCTGLTNHAEAVEIHYDPSKTCLEELLGMFFKTHDPTTPNQQGADRGTQYRSSIFYQDEDEKKAAAAYIKKIGSDFRDPIVTKLEPATKFYPAEEYHQDYFRKNPNSGYCRQVVAKKVRKANNVIKQKAKDPC